MREIGNERSSRRVEQCFILGDAAFRLALDYLSWYA